MGSTPTGATTARHPAHRKAHGWPFMAAPEAKQALNLDLGVPPRQEVEFGDGTRIWLLRVERHGTSDLFLRDLGAPATGTRIDLRKLVAGLENDLQRAPRRDVPGIVHFSLRSRFKSAKELLQAAVAAGRPA